MEQPEQPEVQDPVEFAYPGDDTEATSYVKLEGAGTSSEVSAMTGGGPAPETGGGADPSLHSMTRTELDALAEQRGVDVTGARTKQDVIDALGG